MTRLLRLTKWALNFKLKLTNRRCIETTCNVRSDGSLDGPEDCQILTDLRYNKLLPKESLLKRTLDS